MISDPAMTSVGMWCPKAVDWTCTATHVQNVHLLGRSSYTNCDWNQRTKIWSRVQPPACVYSVICVIIVSHTFPAVSTFVDIWYSHCLSIAINKQSVSPILAFVFHQTCLCDTFVIRNAMLYITIGIIEGTCCVRSTSCEIAILTQG